MKGTVFVAGIGLTAGAAAAVLLATSRLAPGSQERSLHFTPVARPQAERARRRRCVRLGWKAPYWYVGVPRQEALESRKH